MPPIRVGVPGVGVVEFPEGTPPEKIRIAIKEAGGQPISEPEAFGEAFRLGAPTLQETTMELGKMAVPSVLPILGQFGGAAAGGLFSSPSIAGVPVGVLAGEAAGGAAGESLNQMLGITEPSAGQIGLAAGSGIIGRGVGGAVSGIGRFMGKRLPGTSVILQEEAVARAKNLSQRFTPIKVSEQLFKELSEVSPNLRVPTKNLRSFAKQLLKQEKTIAEEGSEVLQNPTLRNLAEDLLAPPGRTKELQGQLKNLQTTSPIVGPRGEAIESTLGLAQRATIVSQLEKLGTEKSVSPDGMRLILKRIGQKTGSVRGLISTEEREAFKGLYAALQQDIDDAIKAGGEAGAASSMLKIARESVRRERAVIELGEVIESGVLKREGDLLESIKPKKILEAFKGNKILMESFSKEEQKEIIQTITSLKGLPALPPRGGVDVGSARVLGRTVGVGGSAGFLTGDPATGMLIGGLAGAAPFVIARVATTETGRKIMRKLLTPQGFLDHRGFSILAAYVRAQTAATPESEP